MYMLAPQENYTSFKNKKVFYFLRNQIYVINLKRELKVFMDSFLQENLTEVKRRILDLKDFLQVSRLKPLCYPHLD